ncbi:hypothetical protein LOAG_04434, partial [Loa loa]
MRNEQQVLTPNEAFFEVIPFNICEKLLDDNEASFVGRNMCSVSRKQKQISSLIDLKSKQYFNLLKVKHKTVERIKTGARKTNHYIWQCVAEDIILV